MNALMALTVVAYGLIAVGGRHRRRSRARSFGRAGPFDAAGWSGGVGTSGANGRVVGPWRPGRSIALPAWVFPVALGLIGAVGWFPWGTLVAGAWPVFRRVRRAGLRRHSDAVWTEGVDVLVTLVGLGLEGGASVRRAVADALPWVGGDVGRVLRALLDRVDRGASLADELESMAAAARPQLAGFARVVAATERYGAPAVSELEALAVERRFDERQRLERVARRVPVQLLVPLVCGVLPAFVLLSVVPMLAGALGNLRGLAP